jgi:formylglycine-generating enzyme required for sulfatase activity
VRATSCADTTRSAEAAVTLLVPDGIAVAVVPATDAVHLGYSRQFSATVTGTAARKVTWSVDEGPAHGMIDTEGVYTAPAILPDPPEATVRAVSVADPSKSGTASVNIYQAGHTPLGFVRVPAGSFVMGDQLAACGLNLYPVTLTRDFYLGQTEVTNEQYREMAQWAYDHGYVTVAYFSVVDARGSTQELLALYSDGCEISFKSGVFGLRDAGHGVNPHHPVKAVTWYGAAAYCDWLSLKEGFTPAYDHTNWRCNGGDPYRAWGYRLPTDAEWEFAAQYDDERRYPWGNANPSSYLANYADHVSWTTTVGSYAAEKRFDGDGLYDMAGNVLEWCNDWFECFAFASATDPVGPPTGTYRLLRGGSWLDADSALRCAMRLGVEPRLSNNNEGFRVARTVIP